MATRRLELGFAGGTALRVDVEEATVTALTQSLAANAARWTELATDDGSCWVDLAEVVYVRVTNEGPRGVGFSGA